VTFIITPGPRRICPLAKSLEINLPQEIGDTVANWGRILRQWLFVVRSRGYEAIGYQGQFLTDVEAA
jgi:hypothetical protein